MTLGIEPIMYLILKLLLAPYLSIVIEVIK